MGKISLFITLSFLVGCGSTNCRRKNVVPAYPGNAISSSSPAVLAPNTLAPVKSRVLVYKYDGSLQCGAGKVISLAEMQKDLGGIKVFSRKRKQDGLMHIQVCGAATGSANVYEILSSDLKKAKAKGFQLWKF